ncbi:unnamed protein product [Coregonus sp. 'balchen']|nr:unnamed protein product [Coregonus sp. 'balchen']
MEVNRQIYQYRPFQLHTGSFSTWPRSPLSAMATRMDTLPVHLLPLAMEEFPQPVVPGVRLCSRGHREPRLRMQTHPSSFSDITEEEDQALRSFLKTLESLRWSTQGWPCRL